MEKKALKVLFIGNSHTFMNDMPELFRQQAEAGGYDCDVTMIAHGGWYLKQHTEEPDVKFNIKYGHYDYVVLQEHSHPFDHIEDYFEAVKLLDSWIREAGSRTLIYGTWSRESEPFNQELMNTTFRKAAGETGALATIVGEIWWDYKASHPDLYMYKRDGSHASSKGSALAAKCIWETIEKDLTK